MSKIMQKFVLFIEPSEDAWRTPFKAGHFYMNRFAIEEDENCEIIKIFELEKSSDKMSYSYDPEYENFEEERNQKGMSFFIY